MGALPLVVGGVVSGAEDFGCCVDGLMLDFIDDGVCGVDGAVTDSVFVLVCVVVSV